MSISKTVYSLLWPETHQVVDELWSSKPHSWYEDNYTKKQNDMHQPLLNGWREWVAKANVKIGKHLSFDYPTNGASEGIQHVMAYYATHNRYKPAIHVFEGEYEGYRKIAEALGLKVYIHTRHNYQEVISDYRFDGDMFWISQPSAIDGNLWPEFDNFVQWMNKNAATMPIIVDLTYVGAVAKEYKVDLTSPNIKVVLWSLSKPFGVYYHRIGGLVSSLEIPSLHGNFWFKNLFSLHLGAELMKRFDPHTLPQKYIHQQNDAIDWMRRTPRKVCYKQNEVVASDVVLLAYKKFEPNENVNDEYIRVKNDTELVGRYCLTPTMDIRVNYKSMRK